MRRRALLASVGCGLLAGCATLDTGPGTDDRDTTTEPPTRTPTDRQPTDDADDEQQDAAPPEYTSIVDLDTADRTYALRPTDYRSDDEARVTVAFTSTATADSPATVAATLTNGNEFENTFDLEWLPPFGRTDSRPPYRFGVEYDDRDLGYESGLLFVPTENHDLVDHAPELERDDDGLWRVLAAHLSDSPVPDSYRLAPGEAIRGEYALVGHPDGAGQGRPTGVYEFRSDDTDLAVSVWETSAPGPTAASRFAGTSVPPVTRGDPDGDTSRTAWYHDADGTTPTFVRPSTERGRLPEQVRFVFVNRSRASTSCGHWNLYKLVDGSWFHVTPLVHTADCRVVPPGGTETWTLNCYPGEALDSGHEPLSVGYLGAGRYAAVAGYGHATPRSAALVDLTGPDLALEPTEDVTSERADSTVTVTAPHHTDDDEHDRPATLTVTRTDAAPDHTLIPEQVMRRRFRALRNTLSFFERGVETVVLRSDTRVVDRALGYEREPTTFELDGQAYRAEVAVEAESSRR